MKKYANARDFCQDKGIPLANVQKTFAAYNKMKPGDCPWGKKFFPATPFEIEEGYHVAQITPINHYTMGGIKINEHAEVIRTDGKVMQGAFCAGEATGGVHGRNRLGGSALLECVVYGRIAGATVSDYVGSGRCGPASLYAGGNTGGSSSDAKSGGSSSGENKVYTLEEVAKHNTDSDCWVVVGGKVLDVTNFLDDHPGGKMAIMTFAGKDATEMFDMVHEAGTLEKYAPETIIGTLAPSSKL
jgi:succinate dehydrogenase/fumarate reductase flavoprotein subunit